MILEAPLNANERCAGKKCKLPHSNNDMVIVNPGVGTTSNVGVRRDKPTKPGHFYEETIHY